MSVRCLLVAAILVAQGLALSFLEMLLPLPAPVPGAKLGLANAVTLAALYTLPRQRDVLLVSVLRVVLASFFCGGPSLLLYSLSGALGSLAVMLLLKRRGVSIISVSAAGGLTHNLCQLGTAMLVLHSSALLSLLPLLSLAGLAAGWGIGVLGKGLAQRLQAHESYVLSACCQK